MIKEQEIWKSIPGYEKYEASTLGKIRSLNYLRTGKIKELKQGKSKLGYLFVVLCDNSKNKRFAVHQLIALTFLENSNNWKEVNHIDSNKQNNQVDNLEWSTRSLNIRHSVKAGTFNVLHGEKNGNSKLTNDQVIQIKKHLLEGILSGQQIAEKCNTNKCRVSDIKTQRSWKHIKL